MKKKSGLLQDVIDPPEKSPWLLPIPPTKWLRDMLKIIVTNKI